MPAFGPLTRLSDEEGLFQSVVARFARERLAPHVRAMDDSGQFRKELLSEFFELGLMAVEIPEEYGGEGGRFFLTIPLVEGLGQGGSFPSGVLGRRKTPRHPTPP